MAFCGKMAEANIFVQPNSTCGKPICNNCKLAVLTHSVISSFSCRDTLRASSAFVELKQHLEAPSPLSAALYMRKFNSIIEEKVVKLIVEHEAIIRRGPQDDVESTIKLMKR